LEEEGAMDEKMGGARQRGAFQTKDSADVITEAAKKQKEAQKHLSNIGMGGMSPEFATKGDLKDMEQKLMMAIDTMKNVQPKPSSTSSSKEPTTMPYHPPEE
jgi:hypothetical protein